MDQPKWMLKIVDENDSNNFFEVESDSELGAIYAALSELGYSAQVPENSETAKQIDYLKDSSVCPFCGSDNITADGDYNLETRCQRIFCMDCGRYWLDLYALIGFDAAD